MSKNFEKIKSFFMPCAQVDLNSLSHIAPKTIQYGNETVISISLINPTTTSKRKAYKTYRAN